MDRKTPTESYSVTVDGMDQKRWNQILEHFADASIYQTWEYGTVRWGAKNLSHMVLKKGGQVISAAQVRLLTDPIFGKGMAYIFFGPLWKTSGSPRNIHNFQEGLRALIDEYAVKRGLFLRLRPWGFCDLDSDLESSLIDSGFRYTGGLFKETKRTILVDLRPPVEELRRHLRKKWRYSLKCAEGESVGLRESFDLGGFNEFIPLFHETLESKKFKPGSDVSEFLKMQEILPLNHRMRITLASEKGQLLSGSVCSALGDTTIGLLKATNEGGRRLQTSYLLQWNEILWAKDKGCSFYDLNGINPDANPGVFHFKSGLGGKEVTLLGVFDYSESRFLDMAVSAFEQFAILRQRIGI